MHIVATLLAESDSIVGAIAVSLQPCHQLNTVDAIQTMAVTVWELHASSCAIYKSGFVASYVQTASTGLPSTGGGLCSYAAHIIMVDALTAQQQLPYLKPTSQKKVSDLA